MAQKVFISYRHHQQEWVWDRLVPVLEAGGVDLLIDRDRFKAGEGVVGQMYATQDSADASVLVITPQYLESAYCRHEMQRAVGKHKTIPVVRADCDIPESLQNPDPLLRVDLQEPEDPDQWGALLEACEAPSWLKASERVVRYLERGQSVNLVVKGEALWKPLLRRVRRDLGEPLGEVDLERGLALSRPSLVELILEQCGVPRQVAPEPEDLIELDRALDRKSAPSHLAMLHFDYAAERDNYGLDLFTTLRHLMMGSRKLVLLAHSHKDFANLLPKHHPMSSLTSIQTVELRGRPR